MLGFKKLYIVEHVRTLENLNPASIVIKCQCQSLRSNCTNN